jgi:predicted NBD/HSP70 family sugar kinase
MTYILFDIGGTKTRVAVSSDLQKIDHQTSFKTPAVFADGMKKFIEEADKLIEGEKVKGIAGGIRGVLNDDKTGLDNDPGGALSKWVGKSIVDALTKRYKAKFFMENDAAIAGLGEAVYGAGKGADIVAYHTVSTGVGGAKIEFGELDATMIGFEPGQQVIDVDRTVLGPDTPPTLENIVSGTAVERRFGMKPYEIPQSDVLWRDLAVYLAQGLRNTTLYWSPEVIVLGGSMITGDPRIEIEDIRKATVESLDGYVETPHITMAKLGDDAGLYGAMAILKKRL